MKLNKNSLAALALLFAPDVMGDIPKLMFGPKMSDDVSGNMWYTADDDDIRKAPKIEGMSDYVLPFLAGSLDTKDMLPEGGNLGLRGAQVNNGVNVNFFEDVGKNTVDSNQHLQGDLLRRDVTEDINKIPEGLIDGDAAAVDCANNGVICLSDNSCCSGRCDLTCKAKVADGGSCNENTDCISGICRLDLAQCVLQTDEQLASMFAPFMHFDKESEQFPMRLMHYWNVESKYPTSEHTERVLKGTSWKVSNPSYCPEAKWDDCDKNGYCLDTAPSNSVLRFPQGDHHEIDWKEPYDKDKMGVTYKVIPCSDTGNTKIIYHFFYVYQQPCMGSPYKIGNQWHCIPVREGEHDNDWEKVVVELENVATSPTILSVKYYQHAGSYTRKKGKFDYETSADGGMHPKVYVGKNSNGSYHAKGGNLGGCLYFEDHMRSPYFTLRTWEEGHLDNANDNYIWNTAEIMFGWSGKVGQGEGDRRWDPKEECAAPSCVGSDPADLFFGTEGCRRNCVTGTESGC